MSITTPDPVETPDALKVKAAGEGAMRAENPFEKWLPEYLTVDEYDTAVPAAKTKAVSDAKGASKLIERAKSFVGTPYKWGGTGPLGFDCSGFTQYLYNELGINLPRISNQQGTYGARVSIEGIMSGRGDRVPEGAGCTIESFQK